MDVLVVDDHEINRIVLVRMLQKLGYRTDIATSGLEAINATKTKVYQVIFMDIQMPKMDGLMAAKEILSSAKTPPYIVGIAWNASDKRECLRLGMADFIEQPVSIQRIKAVISSFTKSKNN